MCQAILRGLYSQSDLQLAVYDPNEQIQAVLRETFPLVALAANYNEAVANADVIILAVKPQVMKQVCLGVAPCVVNSPLVLSVAAGVSVSSLQLWFPGKAIVRAMPNTPALISQGATALFAAEGCSVDDKKKAEVVMGSVSKQLHWVTQESDLDTVTALSGSGPAYFFLLIEILENAAVEMGLDRKVARGLVAQTCVGSGLMVLNSTDADPVELRRRVTSPNGTTHAGITTAESLGVRELWTKVLQAARDRSIELSKL